MKKFAIVLLCAFAILATAAEQSPYSGEELRPIKSLSEREITALRRGDGMGFAKLAELNHYPGPRHVLQLSEALDLSTVQRAATEDLNEEMRRNAVKLGEQLLHAEAQLDDAFQSGTLTVETLEAALLRIGKLRAKLRFVHLEAHLRQKQILTEAQVQAYDDARGYHGNSM